MTADDGQRRAGAELPATRPTCPNDQNLIHVQGRAVARPPPSRRCRRQGIPDLGACIRCNFQIEGSGVKPTDVIIDARHGATRAQEPDGASPAELRQGRRPAGRPRRRLRRPQLPRPRRARARHLHRGDRRLPARPHEVLLERRLRPPHLHLRPRPLQNCDGVRRRRRGRLPGRRAGDRRAGDKSFYPERRAINTVVNSCDLHGSALGYSGSMGNAVRITHNHIYGNTTGITTDTMSAGGHPASRPTASRSTTTRSTRTTSTSTATKPPFEPTVGVCRSGPGCSGRATTTAASTTTGSSTTGARARCCSRSPTRGHARRARSPQRLLPGPQAPMTSCGNQYYGNHMGQAPPGFKPYPALDMFGNHVSGDSRPTPNGVDFWWDEAGANPATAGTTTSASTAPRASVTGPGAGSAPDTLPCGLRLQHRPPATWSSSACCSTAFAREGEGSADRCDWYPLPAQPGSAAAKQRQQRIKAVSLSLPASDAEELSRPDRRAARKPARGREGRGAGHEPASRPLTRSRSRPWRLALRRNSDGEPEAVPVGAVRVGSVAQLAECRDWNPGSRRRAAGDDRRDQGADQHRDAGVETPDLSDEHAYAVFDSACATASPTASGSTSCTPGPPASPLAGRRPVLAP